jgi:hypothetical protein
MLAASAAGNAYDRPLYALDVGSALSYIIAVVVPALDALIPVLPS